MLATLSGRKSLCCAFIAPSSREMHVHLIIKISTKTGQKTKKTAQHNKITTQIIQHGEENPQHKAAAKESQAFS